MTFRHRIFSFLVSAVLMIGAPPAFANANSDAPRAVELVMMEQALCEWCEAWDAEVGPAYPNSWEGHAAPLRRVDIFDDRPPDLAHLRGTKFTPTFILMVDGEEIGRMTGYVGEDFFWGLLDELLAEAGFHAPVAN